MIERNRLAREAHKLRRAAQTAPTEFDKILLLRRANKLSVKALRLETPRQRSTIQ